MLKYTKMSLPICPSSAANIMLGICYTCEALCCIGHGCCAVECGVACCIAQHKAIATLTLPLLGFDVWFCLFVAVCSAVAAVCVCVYALLVLCICCTCLLCVWGKPTKGDRTLDRVRVNGLRY